MPDPTPSAINVKNPFSYFGLWHLHYIRIQGGDCHPNYVFCEETQTCNPLLYSACGYSDWLKNLMLEKCIQQSPRHLIKQCIDDYRLK